MDLWCVVENGLWLEVMVHMMMDVLVIVSSHRWIHGGMIRDAPRTMIKDAQILLIVQPVTIEIPIRPMRFAIFEELFPGTRTTRTSPTGMSRIWTRRIVVQKMSQVSGS